MAHEVELLAGGKHASLTRLSDTLAGSALGWMLEAVEHELEGAADAERLAELSRRLRDLLAPRLA
jgi:hypothetical protein